MGNRGQYMEIAVFYNDGRKKIGEECGVFGFFDKDGHHCSKLTYYGLCALQHRGQESCGIAINNNGNLSCHKEMGLVSEVFNDKIIDELKGQISIGHVRYSTTGGSCKKNAQPLVIENKNEVFAIAHNGNIVNISKIKSTLENKGIIFHTTTDTELIAHLIIDKKTDGLTVEVAIKEIQSELEGSYSLVIMTEDKLIGVRDPYGLRPLSIGVLGNSYVLTSETCAFDIVNADFLRDVEPGEIIIIDNEGLQSIKKANPKRTHLCVFEYIYLARPDSFLEGISVYEARKQIGMQLAKKFPVKADLVVGVPDSGIAGAIGYAEEAKIPYGEGLLKNRYVGRTFIQPSQLQRKSSIKIKLSVLKNNIKGKRIILVDDSIVRGNTIKHIIELLTEAGAKEVHVRISSPPFLYPCYFGVDVPTRKELIAHNNSLEEIGKQIGASSIGYLGIDNLIDSINHKKANFCVGCFSGKYPIPIEIEEER
jgi:amidophosphoribosyltransferase